MKKFDVVIVGCGLGGLCCGYILSKEGYNVCIVEKNDQIGGCLAIFKRQNHIFDTGMHYIGSMNEGEILYKFFKYFNIIDKLKYKKMDESAFDLIDFQSDGSEYKYAMGHTNFVETLSSYFPTERNAIKAYMDKIKEITDSLNLYNLREISDINYMNAEYAGSSSSQFINSLTTNEKLRHVLAGNNSLYDGRENKSPLYIHALISNFYITSAWRFIDGGDQVATLMADEIRKNGGTIMINAEATKIVVKDQKVTAIEINKTDYIEATSFISDIHPSTMLNLLNPGDMQKSYRNRLNSIENTIGTFAIYAILHPNSFKYINSNIYYFDKYDAWGVGNYTEETWPRGFMLQTPVTSSSPEYATVLNVNSLMNFEDVRKWENTIVEKRGNEYKDFKRIKAEKMLDMVEKRFPGIRKCIKTYYTSSPLTFRDYTGTKDGSMYGYSRDCNNMAQSFIFPKTKISNLFLTGQNINIHGILGVPIGSIQTCGEFLGINYVIKKINEAN